MDRWFLIWFVYVAGTASVFEIACTVVPFLDKYYSLAARTVFWFVVAHSIFVFTRDKIFKQRVKAGNKAVFITGCDSGFGNQLAKQLDSKGFRVFAGCLFSYNGGAAELKRSCSSRLHIVHLDVTKDESVQKAKEFVKNNLAGCDLWAVVNNAGVLKGFTVEFSKMSDYQDTLEVNTLGQVRVTNAFCPCSESAGEGSSTSTASQGEPVAPTWQPTQ
ncbi:17-beta-hydroxysteroid dehydrogenase type 6 [Caerostris extrusa]|uniref:17-beta-hydroxysteroid dehydrogenase type 6 n=1 Tax=Caerostris extrusa TaxID=172846 RepID=A0AAV4NT41_CAEEX|nr:17-beta-hydroxysteroid dehydrogenase type 6 [Caerostris extrusa]